MTHTPVTLIAAVLSDMDSLSSKQLWEAVHASEAMVNGGGNSEVSRADIIRAWRAALKEISRRAGGRTDL